MSKNFIVENINKPNQIFNLDTDVMAGFKKAVNNGQSRLAFEYLTYIIDILAEDTPTEVAEAQPKQVKEVKPKEATAKAE